MSNQLSSDTESYAKPPVAQETFLRPADLQSSDLGLGVQFGFEAGEFPGPQKYVNWTPDEKQFPRDLVQPATFLPRGRADSFDSGVTISMKGEGAELGYRTGKFVLPATQPVIAVPVVQEVQKRDRIIEVPQTVVVDKLVPRVYHQEVFHEVPNVTLGFNEVVIEVPEIEVEEKVIEIPVPCGLNFKIKPVWKTREVPRVFPKYIGEDKIIEMEVPKVKVVEKRIEKEVPVYVGEKVVIVPQYEEEEYEIFDYQYVIREEEVPVYRYMPVVDVQIDIPSPVVVPVPLEPKTTYLEPHRLTFEEYIEQRKTTTGTGCC